MQQSTLNTSEARQAQAAHSTSMGACSLLMGQLAHRIRQSPGARQQRALKMSEERKALRAAQETLDAAHSTSLGACILLRGHVVRRTR